MIVPGNIRERPRGLDLAALGYQITRELDGLIDEAIDAEGLAITRIESEGWKGVDVLQLKDRCMIVRQELDIIKRLLKLSGNHEVHDSH